MSAYFLKHHPNLQVCSKSAVYNLSALESKIYELCSTEEGQKKYKFCPKKNTAQKKDIVKEKEVSSCKFSKSGFEENGDPSSYIYKGECKNGFANGHGIVRFPDGHQYEGEFERGMRNYKGAGIFTFPNGESCISEQNQYEKCARAFSRSGGK